MRYSGNLFLDAGVGIPWDTQLSFLCDVGGHWWSMSKSLFIRGLQNCDILILSFPIYEVEYFYWEKWPHWLFGCPEVHERWEKSLILCLLVFKTSILHRPILCFHCELINFNLINVFQFSASIILTGFQISPSLALGSLLNLAHSPLNTTTRSS